MKTHCVRLACFLLFLLFLLPSCGQKNSSPREILDELMAVSGELPEGTVFLSDAEEGSEEYLSPTLLRAMYGEEAEEEFEAVEDSALYLSSFAAPYEIAVFRCYSATDARRIEALCLYRADEIRVALRETDFYSLIDSLRVLCRGKTVILMLTAEPDETERLALRLI